MEPSPSSPLEVAEPHLLLELLIVVLDAPAQLGVIDQPPKVDVLGKRREPELGRLLFAFWPFDEQPFFRIRFGEPVIAMSDAHPRACKPRRKRRCSTFAPGDLAPGACRQIEGEILNRDRLMLG